MPLLLAAATPFALPRRPCAHHPWVRLASCAPHLPAAHRRVRCPAPCPPAETGIPLQDTEAGLAVFILFFLFTAVNEGSGKFVDE